MVLAIAVVAAAVAGWLTLPQDARLHLRPGGPTQPAARGRLRLGTFAVAALGVGATLALRPPPHLVLVAATTIAASGAGVHLVRRGRRRAHRAARRRQVVDVCDGLVAELRAGQPPAHALTWVARTWPELEAASRLARLGGDVPTALRQTARTPGAEPLAHLAAGWEVAQRCGASLADVLDRLSRSLRDDADVRREVGAALGPTRATGRLLAILPLFGLGLGFTMGADPLSVLLGSTFGAVCLASGAALAVVGLLWVERIADRAEPC